MLVNGCFSVWFTLNLCNAADVPSPGTAQRGHVHVREVSVCTTDHQIFVKSPRRFCRRTQSTEQQHCTALRRISSRAVVWQRMYTVVRIMHGDAPCPNFGSHCKSSMGGSPFDRTRVTSRLQCTGTTAMAAPSALSECGVSVVGSDPLHGADRALDCGPAYAGRVKVCFSTNPAAESLTTLRGQHRFLSSTTWPWLRAPVSVLFDRSRTQ